MISECGSFSARPGVAVNADCVVEGNRCRRGGEGARLPVVEVKAATVAGDNRIDGPKDNTALSIGVSRNDKQQRPAATVLGNVVTTRIAATLPGLPAATRALYEP